MMNISMQMTNADVKHVTVKGYSLLNIRIWCYSSAFFYLLITGFVALTIDLTVDEDPKVRVYYKLRWYFLTCWCNIMLFGYILFCIYCDWQEISKKDTNQLNKLKRVRDTIMTSILFPITVYCDLAFWAIYMSYPEIIAPPGLFDYIPLWVQHSAHTVSLGFVIMDLVMTPRRRPSSYKPGLAVLIGFMMFYTLVVYVNYTRGYMVYLFLETAWKSTCILVFSATLSFMTVTYYVQWYIIDYVWQSNYIIMKEVKQKEDKKEK